MHKIRDLLIEKGYKLVSDGEFWRCRALYREGINPTSLCINKKTGWFTDFSANISGDANDLSKLLKSEIVFEALAKTEKEDDFSILKTYPEDCLKVLLPQYGLYENLFSKSTLEIFGAGMCHSGRLFNRVVFPIRTLDGKIMGFSGRFFQKVPPKDTIKKWLHHKFKTSMAIYPAHLTGKYISEKSEVILLESIGDAMALWDVGIKNFIVMFGVRVSKKVLAFLLAKNVNRIIIGTNNDSNKEGIHTGNLASEQIKRKLLSQFNEDQIKIALPEKEENDLANMTKERRIEWYESI